ncbi:hypothetical protein [Emticicia agri]|uniref:hypothetical protein n=1 Tax=Emticicia agri TaxID=2492393 RepID=UPI0013EDA796|nr:hypothetical protein [Emticicia agri]
MKSTELSEKFMVGLNLAIKRLVEKSALNNDTLIISDKQGNVKEVPAKELLKNYENK